MGSIGQNNGVTTPKFIFASAKKRHNHPAQKVRVMVVAARGNNEIRERVRKIKEWCSQTDLHRKDDSPVENIESLEEGLNYAQTTLQNTIDKVIIITIGYRTDEVKEYIDQIQNKNLKRLEVIIQPPNLDFEGDLDGKPTSSRLTNSYIINVQNAIPALRKSIIRQRTGDLIKVRELKTPKELYQYFSLRYKVWKDLNYLPSKYDCQPLKLEIIYTDRDSVPIGAFTHQNKLVGCGRLVYPLNATQTISRAIEEIVEKHKDRFPNLSKFFKYPENFKYQFDFLESIEELNTIYAEDIRNNIIRNNNGANINIAEVSRIITHPEYRKQGIGEVLLDSLMSIAAQRRIGKLYLACTKKHQAFYERAGFKLLEGMESPNFDDLGVPAIAMSYEQTYSN